MSARCLHAELERLRDDPSVDFETLQKVDAVLKQHSGQRVVILPHSKKKDRLKTARAIASTVDSRSLAIASIAERVGVSRVTGWRYWTEINRRG